MPGERQVYICNPLKNTKCRRTMCGIMDGAQLSNPHCCFLTTHKDYALELIDVENAAFYYNKKRIERWLTEYYGKEEEANGGPLRVERHEKSGSEQRDGD